MSKIVDIQLGRYGKVQSFDTAHFVLQKGDKVLVETEQGPAFGIVCTDPKNAGKDVPDKSSRRVYRLANEQDLERFEKNCSLEKEVDAFCHEKIKERSLPMCLISVECLFDGSKMMIFFTSDGRVDFRDLVKDLVQRFRRRIEMRQIGVRHQAKMVGGLGTCGRQLCCTSFVNNFEPVSIKMAKEQNLSLNPNKISGMCGRLMCCLSFEYGYYEKVKKHLPKIGRRVKTVHGDGKVIRQNIWMERLTVLLDSGEEKDISFEEIVRNDSGGSRGGS